MKMLMPADIEYCIEIMSGSASPPKIPHGRHTGIGMYIKPVSYTHLTLPTTPYV